MSAEKPRIEPTIGPPIANADWNEARPAPVTTPDRPVFLSIVACVFLLSGIAAAALFLAEWTRFSSIAADVGLGSEWPYAAMLMSIAYIAAGMFLLAGGPIGWYLTAFVLVESLAAAVFGWMLLVEEGIQFAFWAGHTISGYSKIGLRILLTSALMAYMFSSAVREYCSITWIKGVLAVAVVVGLESVISILES